MTEYHHYGDNLTRFLMQIFVVQTQTVRLDVSELSTGVLLDSHDPPLEDCDSEGNLPRRLFPEGSDGASQAGGNSITPTQVTIDSSVAVGTHYVNSGLATDQETAPDRVNGMAVNHGNEENVDVDAFLETALNARSTQRIRFKYSRMYFYGTSDMYLKIDTEGEDRYDVDFTENFWQQRSQIQDMVNEGDDDEEVPEEDKETRIVFPDEP